jgi:hypothetical protein
MKGTTQAPNTVSTPAFNPKKTSSCSDGDTPLHLYKNTPLVYPNTPSLANLQGGAGRRGGGGPRAGPQSMVPLGFFWLWAEQALAQQGEAQHDAVPEDWQELGRWAECAANLPAPVEEDDGLTFCPDDGCAPFGGPSRALREAVGLGDPAAVDPDAAPGVAPGTAAPDPVTTDLMLGVFDFFFRSPPTRSWLLARAGPTAAR